MGAVTNVIEDFLNKIATIVFDNLPSGYQNYVNLGIFIVLITIYAMFVWKFYRFLAKRDLLELNLNQYNNAANPVANKMLAVLLFIVEYILILPIVVFFWFFVMAFILLFLARDQDVETILLISGCIVGAVRITSYYSQDLSRDLAKMFPFTILAIALVQKGFFDVIGKGGIIDKFASIDSLFVNVLGYLLIIMAIEFFLRMVHIITYQGKKIVEKK